MKQKFLKTSVFLGVALLLGACQSPSEKMIEKANENIIENAIEESMGGNADVDIDEGNVSIETKQGTIQAGENVVLPDNFPADVYVYEGKLSAALFNEENNGFNLTIETEDSLDDVKSVYENELKEGGWVINQSMNLADTLYMGAEKEGRVISVVANQTDETTMIVLNVNDK